MADTASAPAASTARATATMSVTFGVSLTISGSRVTARTAEVSSAARSGSTPTGRPLATCGHEMFSSSPATPGTPARRRPPAEVAAEAEGLSDGLAPYSDPNRYGRHARGAGLDR